MKKSKVLKQLILILIICHLNVRSYLIQKLNLFIFNLVRLGDRHPDPVVETSSLASVELPDITYQLTISNEKIQLNTLSALQLETIVYASQRHNTFLPDGTRAGFLIGMKFSSEKLFAMSIFFVFKVMELVLEKVEQLLVLSMKIIYLDDGSLFGKYSNSFSNINNNRIS